MKKMGKTYINYQCLYLPTLEEWLEAVVDHEGALVLYKNVAVDEEKKLMIIIGKPKKQKK